MQTSSLQIVASVALSLGRLFHHGLRQGRNYPQRLGHQSLLSLKGQPVSVSTIIKVHDWLSTASYATTVENMNWHFTLPKCNDVSVYENWESRLCIMRSATVAFSVILRDDREAFIIFPIVLWAVNMGFCRVATFWKTYWKSILCTVCYPCNSCPRKKEKPKETQIWFSFAVFQQGTIRITPGVIQAANGKKMFMWS